MTETGASGLRAEMAAVRTAVGAHDADGAARALDALRASVARLRRSGDVTEDRAAAIFAAATTVEAQLALITTTTTTTAPTPPAVPHDPGDDGNGKGKGNGKGGGAKD